MSAVIQLLGTIRLLTLTGPGGIGKTRVALEVATTVRNMFADGVAFIPLAAIDDPALVFPTIARAFVLPEMGDQPAAITVARFLADRHMLLVLDNFEQVVAAAPQVAGLLSACSRLHVMITSRGPLRVAGEQEFPVPPLALPDGAHAPVAEELAGIAAIALFVERAHAIAPDFVFTDAMAPVVAKICSRLDGLPLAIELAAARTKLLSPASLLSRLDHALALLTGGARDLPVRQQTLRNTIDWSYRLLDGDEQRLFARLAIFAGGCGLEAVEAICGADATSLHVLNGVASLIDKSLLRVVTDRDSEPQISMLETVREYACERLAESEERKTIARAHAAYFIALAEAAAAELQGAQQMIWLARLERENDNLRAALRWLLDAGEAEDALRLVTALYSFWMIRGYLSEGRRWFEEVLPQTMGADPSARARALGNAGYLIRMQGDNVTARTLSEECLNIAQGIGDTSRIGQALYNLALIAQYQGDYTTARAFHSECLALYRDQDMMLGVAYCLANLGEIAQHQGNYDTARTFLEESLTILRTNAGDYGIAYPLNDLGVVAREQGNLAAARSYLEESLTIRRVVNDKRGLAHTLHNLGVVARDEGDDKAARALHEEGLTLQRELGDQQGIVRSLSCLGALAARAGDRRAAAAHYHESLTTAGAIGDRLGIIENVEGFAEMAAGFGGSRQSARLWGAAASLRGEIGAPIAPAQRAAYEQAIVAARSRCNPAQWAVDWSQGQQMTVVQVVACACEVLRMLGKPDAPQPAAYPAGLSSREVEVLRLLAAGHTNREIAAALFLSERTVHVHLTHIYTKTKSDNRAAATAFAYQQGLA